MMTSATSFDFQSAVLDTRITFARAGNTATRVNSAGNIEAVSADVARFDYDPITLVCRGLLVEETRVNQCLQSLNLAASSSWAANSLSYTANQLTAPNGNLEAALYNEGTASAQHYVNNAASSVTSGTTYTASVYVKAGTVQWFQIPLSSGTFGTNAWGNFDVVNGVVGNKGSAATTSIVAAGNGWWRCIISAPATATISAATLQIAFCGNTNTASRLPSTTGTSKTMYVWGAQVEAGAFATSYIPTTSAAVTRNADVATITGTNFSNWWQANKGGVLVRARPSTVSGTRPWVQFDDGTANEIITLRGNTTNPELYIVDGGAAQVQIDAGTIAANTVYRFAAGWKLNECAASINGGNSVLDGQATIPTVTQARLGSDGTNYLNGHIQTIEYYNFKPTNETLQQLSSSAGRFSVLSPILKQVVQS